MKWSMFHLRQSPINLVKPKKFICKVCTCIPINSAHYTYGNNATMRCFTKDNKPDPKNSVQWNLIKAEKNLVEYSEGWKVQSSENSFIASMFFLCSISLVGTSSDTPSHVSHPHFLSHFPWSLPFLANFPFHPYEVNHTINHFKSHLFLTPLLLLSLTIPPHAPIPGMTH